jgi:DNA invertase Pin-like site-specific DNA recombinase
MTSHTLSAAPVTKQEQPSRRIYGYCRVSGERKEISFAEQERQIRQRAGQCGLNVETIFADHHITGKIPLAQRPQGGQLLRVLHRGDMVICAKSDRMFRNVKDLLHMVDLFREAKIDLVLIDLGEVTDEANFRFILTVRGAFSELERNMGSIRIRESWAQWRAQGRHRSGPRPFGWNVVGEHRDLVADPREQSIIAEIREWRDAGASYPRICQMVAEQFGETLDKCKVRSIYYRAKGIERPSKATQFEEFDRALLPVIEEIRAAGIVSFKQIASELNTRGIAGFKGGQWGAHVVEKLLYRSNRPVFDHAFPELKISAQRRQSADQIRAAAVLPTIIELWNDGRTSPGMIASELNRRRIPAVRGGKWYDATVTALLHEAGVDFTVAAQHRAAFRQQLLIKIAEIRGAGITKPDPIARELNARNVPPPGKGRQWYGATVSLFLMQNERDLDDGAKRKAATRLRRRQKGDDLARQILPIVAELRAQGLIHAEIADRLNQQGLRTYQGKLWNAGTLGAFVCRREPPTELANDLPIVALMGHNPDIYRRRWRQKNPGRGAQ